MNTMNIGKRATFILSIVALTLTVGFGTAFGATPVTITSTDVPVAITDKTTVTSTITVPCLGTVTDINVQIDITHTWLPDLDIYLIAPDGTRVELSTGNGGGGGSYTGTIFDDEAAASITGGTSPFAGSYQPEGLLSTLDGIPTGGTWTLEVTETDFFGDTGSLDAWSLTFERTPGGTNTCSAPLPITDNTTILSTMEVFDDVRIADINVQIDITHTWVSDLDIFLIAPDGTRVELTTGNGEDGDDFTGTIFDDQAATSITTVVNTDAPFTGSYQPEGPLAALDEKQASGLWTLEVRDTTPGDEGTLNSWSLFITKSTIAPQPITDLTTTLCTLEIFEHARIGDINVEIDITHTRVSDLDIFLIAPDGTRVELTTGNGDGGANFTGTIFDDQAATPITAVVNIDAPFTGSYQPEGLLSILNTKDAKGIWTLEIYDSTAGDEGILNSWSLIIKQSSIFRWIIPAMLNRNR